MEKEAGELEELRTLDRRVRRPATVFAYIFGSLGAIVMGSGMSLVMTDIGATLGLAAPMLPGVLLGVAGLAMALLTYPIYKRLLSGRRAKYADEILKMSEKLITSAD